MSTYIQTVDARSKLSPRRSPYWQRIHSGFQIGFLKLSSRTQGTWWAQTYDKAHGQRRHKLGSFDDIPPGQRFDAAKRSGEALLTHIGRGGSLEDVTVRMACERYVAHLRADGKAKTGDDAEARFRRFVYGTALASQSIRKLSAQQVRAWRHSIAAKPVVVNPHAKEQRTRPRSPATVNRDMTSLRAALNLARDDGAVDSDAAWRSALRPMAGAQGRRTLCLSKEQRAELIMHAEPDLASFLRGLSLLPLRPGTLAALTVGQLDPTRQVLLVGKDKAGANRSIPLPPGTTTFLNRLAARRPPDAPLIARADGKAWTKDAWKKPIKAAAQAAKLPQETTAYTLRHSVITDLIVGGFDPVSVARLAGTSLPMIDKHYGHLQAKRAVAALATLDLEA